MSSVTGDSATTSKIRKSSDGASVASAPAPDLGRSSPSIVSSIDTEEGELLHVLALSHCSGV